MDYKSSAILGGRRTLYVNDSKLLGRFRLNVELDVYVKNCLRDFMSTCNDGLLELRSKLLRFTKVADVLKKCGVTSNTNFI